LTIAQLAVDAHELAGPETVLLETLLAILRATVRDDKKALGSALAFLRDFETMFRSRVRPLFAAVFGRSWIDVIASKCEASGYEVGHANEMRRIKERNWSLAMYLRTARAAAKLEPPINGLMVAEFGRGWRADSGNVHDLRNQWAHAKETERFPRINDYTEEFVDFIRRTMKAADYLRRLELKNTRRKT
jgi:hypothetical protein